MHEGEEVCGAEERPPAPHQQEFDRIVEEVDRFRGGQEGTGKVGLLLGYRKESLPVGQQKTKMLLVFLKNEHLINRHAKQP